MSHTSLTVYRNRKTGDCLIERFVGSSAVGKFMRVSTAEMQARGLGIISKCLWGEPPPKSEEKPEMAIYSKEEERAFRRLHQSAGIFSAEREIMGIGFCADKVVAMSCAKKRSFGFRFHPRMKNF